MYRLSGTRKRKRSKCYKDSKNQRKTVTLVCRALAVSRVPIFQRGGGLGYGAREARRWE